MNQMDRRSFLARLAGAGLVLAAPASVMALASCSSNSDHSDASKNGLALLRVSSDPYKTREQQRFAFTIFDKTEDVSSGTIPVTLISPSGKKSRFSTTVKKEGLKGNGIYSLTTVLNEAGSWSCESTYKGTKLKTAFSVAENATAPALLSSCPNGDTPTNAHPLDASDLCTRFQGNCGLHDKSVPELLATKKPFLVLFATPARCQTGYCGPILDVVRDVHSQYDIPTIHIEIYESDTSEKYLDAVKNWNLPSEPWLFGVNGEGKIVSRIDGAFDKSEIEASFKQLM
jgi:hypothetical protein